MESQTSILDWKGQNRLTTVQELTNFVTNLIREDCYDGRERRSRLRYNFFKEIVAQHADSDYQPVGHAYAVVTRDISSNGLRLISPTFVEAPNLILEIPLSSGITKRLLMEVLRCRPFRKYFEVGGRFVTGR